jgi:hypothetical protein
LLTGGLHAQTDLTSPYSLYGPGIVNLRQSVAFSGMGGAGIAISDPYRINLTNPAANTFLLDPVFETSGKGSISTFETSTESFENRNFELNNLSLAFPIIRNRWMLGIGLVPFTNVGYDVNVDEVDPDLGVYRARYFGEGGISQGYLGTAYKIYSETDTAGNTSSFSVGAQMNYNFGTITNERTIIYLQDPQSLGFEASESILVRDVSFEASFHGQTNLINRTLSNPRFLKLLVGGVYQFNTELSAEENSYVYNFWNSNGPGVPRDTLSSLSRAKGTITLPSRLMLGIALDYVSRRKARLRLAMDYQVQEWDAYAVSFEDENLNADLERSERYAAGLEFTPELGSTNYLEVIEYRIGAYFEKTNLNLRGEDIEDVGMSFGLTLPVNYRRALTNSSFHITAQYGRNGTTANDLIQENYVRILGGFSFTPHFRNRWFVKPKYD